MAVAAMAKARAKDTIACVVGTRPEVIKMFPVVHALRNAGVVTRLIHTGQHLELSQSAFDTFGLKADVDLEVMSSAQTPSGVASLVLDRLGPVLAEMRPSWLVVQGDTTSVLAAAIAGAYHQIPVAHVEAGLRSHRLDQPFPEEINRRAVGAIASLHFAPTATAARALSREGVRPEQVHLTGNTVIDALRWACDHLPSIPDDPALATIDPTRPMILMTTHRRENFGAGLADVFRAVRRLTELQPDLQFLFPVHPNPAVRAEVDRWLGSTSSVRITSPLSYLDMARALQQCALVLTDSGGLQEEAPALGKQVLVLREVTERPEAIETGMAQLVGTNAERIVPAVLEALQHPIARPTSPYGDGLAGERIAAALQGLPVSAFTAMADAQ
jgi:UDP-N-acetylglucosamine 2-epimerase (non-hydrolysing)